MKLSFKFRKHILLIQMLPHTWIGHPISTLLSIFGFDKTANDFHYFTLPKRTKSKIMKSEINWINNTKLRKWDTMVIPIFSLLDAFGLHNLAARVCYIANHEECIPLGACASIYYEKKNICKLCGMNLVWSSTGWITTDTHSYYCDNNKEFLGKHVLKNK